MMPAHDMRHECGSWKRKHEASLTTSSGVFLHIFGAVPLQIEALIDWRRATLCLPIVGA